MTELLLATIAILLLAGVGLLGLLALRPRKSSDENQIALLLQGYAAQAANSTSDVSSKMSLLSEMIATRMATFEGAQSGIIDLARKVSDINDVFTNKQARGAFGEVQLADIIQTMLAPGNYEMQATLGNGKRVDCLLKLPNPPGDIAIDAKFPLEAWRAMQSAENDMSLQAARKEFASAIRVHIKAIAEKYIVPGETAESAMMFLPSEAIFAEIHSNFPGIVDEAFKARVWIVSPTTIMATLTTMRAVLRDVRMKERAHIVQAKVAQLIDDVTRLDVRVTNLHKHHEQQVEDMRQIRITADKLTKRAEEIMNIGLEGDHSEVPAAAEVRAENVHALARKVA